MSSILLVLCGLVLFLYALNVLSDGLKDLAGDQLKKFIDRFTSNLFRGIVAGAIVTVLLDSSSVVIIMTIALVNSGAMTFRQAIGIVLGANIGTSFSSQIFALDIGEYAALPIVAGFALMFFSKNEFKVNLGKVVFSFGLIFFGLFTMEEAVEPLKQSNYFIVWLQSLENTWKGAGVGALVTVVIQSSSATVGMIIGLASQNMITLTAAIAVTLGAELGTCADTLVASIGRSKGAIRTGLFHFIFNLITILLGMLLLPYFTSFVKYVSAGQNLQRTIANAHMLFNILGVIVIIPVIPVLEKMVNKLTSFKHVATHASASE